MTNNNGKSMNDKFKIIVKLGDKNIILHFDFTQRFISGFVVIVKDVFSKSKFGGSSVKNVVLHFSFVQNIVKYAKLVITKRNIIAVVIAVGSVFGMHFWIGWGYEGSIFIAFAVTLYVMRWDARIAIVGALICLVSIMIMTFLYSYGITEEEWAEKVAVWAYFFLVIGVVGQIIEFAVENKKKKVCEM